MFPYHCGSEYQLNVPKGDQFSIKGLGVGRVTLKSAVGTKSSLGQLNKQDAILHDKFFWFKYSLFAGPCNTINTIQESYKGHDTEPKALTWLSYLS